MAISGNLSEFSLPEVFLLLEQGNKTGLLSIQEQSYQSSHNGKSFYIYFKMGHIVAASDRDDGLGLLSMIQQRGWISARVAARITEICPLDSFNHPQAAGLCLKSQGLLEAEQLKLLFSHQVLQNISKLFELKNGQFLFDSKKSLPITEMTGLSALPKEATLGGLRVLRDWTMLKNKLPEATSGLVSAVTGRPQLRLNQVEWQVWEFVNGNTQLQEIAKQLQLPLEKIQQVAFRLIVVGLIEEIPFLVETSSQELELEMPTLGQMLEPVERRVERTVAVKAPISQSFLQNLVGFLKNKS